MFHHASSINPSISIFRLRWCPCPILWGWRHQTLLNTGSPCISVLWVNASQATLIDISLHTFRPYIFLGLPCFLVLGIGKFVIDLIQDVACFTWPYHLSHRQQRTNAISSIPSFCRGETEGVSSVFDDTDPTDHGTTAELLHFKVIGSPLQSIKNPFQSHFLIGLWRMSGSASFN